MLNVNEFSIGYIELFFCLLFRKPLEHLIHFEFQILEAMAAYLENLSS